MSFSRGLGKKSFGGRWSQYKEEMERDRSRRGYPGLSAKQDRYRKEGKYKLESSGPGQWAGSQDAGGRVPCFSPPAPPPVSARPLRLPPYDAQ